MDRLNSWVVNHNNSRASNDRVIRNRTSGVDKDDISLSVKSSRNDSGISVRGLSNWGKYWSSSSWEGGVKALPLSREVVAWSKLDNGAGDNGLGHVDQVQGWEDIQWEFWVAAWALDNVAGGNAIRLTWAQRDVERARERGALRSRDLLRRICQEAACVTEVGGVAGLDGEDAAGLGEVFFAADERGGTEVGADTDGLDGCGEGEEAGWVGGREVVDAWLDGLGAEGAGEEVDMGLLVAGDGSEVVVEGLCMVSVTRSICGSGQEKRWGGLTAGRPASVKS